MRAPSSRVTMAAEGAKGSARTLLVKKHVGIKKQREVLPRLGASRLRLRKIRNPEGREGSKE